MLYDMFTVDGLRKLYQVEKDNLERYRILQALEVAEMVKKSADELEIQLVNADGKIADMIAEYYTKLKQIQDEQRKHTLIGSITNRIFGQRSNTQARRLDAVCKDYRNKIKVRQ